MRRSVLRFEKIHGRNDQVRRFANFVIKGGMNTPPGTPEGQVRQPMPRNPDGTTPDHIDPNYHLDGRTPPTQRNGETSTQWMARTHATDQDWEVRRVQGPQNTPDSQFSTPPTVPNTPEQVAQHVQVVHPPTSGVLARWRAWRDQNQNRNGGGGVPAQTPGTVQTQPINSSNTVSTLPLESPHLSQYESAEHSSTMPALTNSTFNQRSHQRRQRHPFSSDQEDAPPTKRR